MLTLVKQITESTKKQLIDDNAMNPPSANFPVALCVQSIKLEGITESKQRASSFIPAFLLRIAVAMLRGKANVRAHNHSEIGPSLETMYLSVRSGFLWFPSSIAPVHVDRGRAKEHTNVSPNKILKIRIFSAPDRLTLKASARYASL